VSDGELTFTFDEIPYRIDIAGLTVDEWIELEEQGIEFTAGKTLTMKMLKAAAWAAVHRERPEVTFADLGRVAMMKLLESNTAEVAEATADDVNPSSPVSGSELAGD